MRNGTTNIIHEEYDMRVNEIFNYNRGNFQKKDIETKIAWSINDVDNNCILFTRASKVLFGGEI